jgi:hypothetical protein
MIVPYTVTAGSSGVAIVRWNRLVSSDGGAPFDCYAYDELILHVWGNWGGGNGEFAVIGNIVDSQDGGSLKLLVPVITADTMLKLPFSPHTIRLLASGDASLRLDAVMLCRTTGYVPR